MTLDDLQTPCLILDEAKMNRNIQRLQQHASKLGIPVRPHLKTPKSVEVARRLQAMGHQTFTVSTLKEAEVFANAGFLDITYGVGIAPAKLERVQVIRQKGCDLAIVLDCMAQAQAVIEFCQKTGDRIPVHLEIDSDGHRSGLAPDDPDIVTIAQALHEGGAELRGILTHAGESYNLSDENALAAIAEQERAAAVQAATALRAAGLPCPVVSVGSTPTAHFARHLDGVTEIRAGVYMFFDLVMAGISVCQIDDIALSVLVTVIGHQRSRNWIITDGGWMAMSRDRGTANQTLDQGYGIVCDQSGKPIPDLIMKGSNQEHGILQIRPGSSAKLPDLPVGTQLRILPNHACATAAQYDHYHVIPADPSKDMTVWQRFNGWA